MNYIHGKMYMKKRNGRVRKHNLRCDMYCVNYIHGKMYMEKEEH